MLTTFTLLVAVGGGFRLALSWALKHRFGLQLSIPQGLATVLLVLSAIPDWLKPIPFPLSLGFTLGALLPDLFTRRG
ncbi:hypothetical protein RXV86_12550 [Alisedimentitalea sp. MJ-SS2]|uniref:hypothetical protein n=1 Tax=Aliisedimentitalea sp. MJ-SS2 TaxID=3049795 RepID=UPI0029108C18|nr:hypothetical protein [Alisedimentitalea sp. MJ-SS2]MDU8928219.1 hypothetical protein [Alisedimentitalea sp. MJ-SS2]